MGVECVICLEEINSSAAHMLEECHHVFHQRCITHWLTIKPACPICRHELPQSGPVELLVVEPTESVTALRSVRVLAFVTGIGTLLELLMRRDLVVAAWVVSSFPVILCEFMPSILIVLILLVGLAAVSCVALLASFGRGVLLFGNGYQISDPILLALYWCLLIWCARLSMART